MDTRTEIEDLTAFRARGPGTDAERRAARHLRGRLAALGRAAEVEATWIHPGWPLAWTAYVLMGIVASISATRAPVAGAAFAAGALLLALADIGGRLHIGRRLTGRRASQNVVSREDGGSPGTLILVAHYDAARTGYIYGRMAERRAALGRRTGRPIGPFEPLVWALAVLVVCALLRVGGIDAMAVSIVQFAATVVLIVAVPLLVDLALSSTGPGASDNASGVATVLRLAERYGGDLDNFDVWVLFTGGEEALAEGMRAFMRRHRRDLDPTATIFLNVDTVGNGTVRYSRREGPLVAARLHPRVLALCDQIAAEDADDGRYGARPITIRAVTDAVAVRRARFPAVTVSCRNAIDHAPHLHRHDDTPDRIDDAALERAFGFCSELIELIDEQIGPDVAAAREPAPEGFTPA